MKYNIEAIYNLLDSGIPTNIDMVYEMKLPTAVLDELWVFLLGHLIVGPFTVDRFEVLECGVMSYKHELLFNAVFLTSAFYDQEGKLNVEGQVYTWVNKTRMTYAFAPMINNIGQDGDVHKSAVSVLTQYYNNLFGPKLKYGLHKSLAAVREDLDLAIQKHSST